MPHHSVRHSQTLESVQYIQPIFYFVKMASETTKSMTPKFQSTNDSTRHISYIWTCRLFLMYKTNYTVYKRTWPSESSHLCSVMWRYKWPPCFHLEQISSIEKLFRSIYALFILFCFTRGVIENRNPLPFTPPVHGFPCVCRGRGRMEINERSGEGMI